MAIKKKDKKDDKKDDKKEKSGKKGEREKKPWKSKQLMRLQRVVKGLGKLNKVIKAAKPPGVDVDALELAVTKVDVVTGKIATLPDDWKPARGSTPGTGKKAGAGSTVCIRDDLEADAAKLYGTLHPSKDAFKGATISGEYDNRSWFVKCTDGLTRVVKKKHVALMTAAEATE